MTWDLCSYSTDTLDLRGFHLRAMLEEITAGVSGVQYRVQVSGGVNERVAERLLTLSGCQRGVFHSPLFSLSRRSSTCGRRQWHHHWRVPAAANALTQAEKCAHTCLHTMRFLKSLDWIRMWRKRRVEEGRCSAQHLSTAMLEESPGPVTPSSQADQTPAAGRRFHAPNIQRSRCDGNK